LSKDDLPLIKETYNLLVRFENKSGFQNIRGALHSFNSIYDRQWNQGEDQLVDAITALEGLFSIDLMGCSSMRHIEQTCEERWD
jgi:hypothetical protein